MISDILKSLFYEKLFKIVSLDKRCSHTGYKFLSCLVITDCKLTWKVVCFSIFLKIRNSILTVFLMKNASSIHFNHASRPSSNVNYSVIFQRHFNLRHLLFSLILSAKKSKLITSNENYLFLASMVKSFNFVWFWYMFLFKSSKHYFLSTLTWNNSMLNRTKKGQT